MSMPAPAVALSPSPAYDASAFGDSRRLSLVTPPRATSWAMKNKQQFAAFFANALHLYQEAEAEAILLLLENPIDWDDLRPHLEQARIVVAADKPESLVGAEEMGLGTILLDMGEVAVLEKLTQALLNGVARDVLNPGADVVAVYSGFDSEH